MQTKRQSLAEGIINIFIGYIINFMVQLIVFPLVGLSVSINQNLMIGVLFTASSLARQYFIRRYFNSKAIVHA